MITVEELTERLVQYHAVPYRNRRSAAEELASEIMNQMTGRYLKGIEKAAELTANH